MKNVRTSEAIRKAQQHLAAAFQTGKAPLTMPQAEVLRALFLHGPQYQRQITDLTGIDRSTLSSILQRLANDAMVANAKLEGHRRAILVTITPAGRKALDKANGALLTAEAKLVGFVLPADRAAFLRGLRAIAEAV